MKAKSISNSLGPESSSESRRSPSDQQDQRAVRTGARRRLEILPIGDGPEVASTFPTLRRLLDGQGPALLPVPANDPVRAQILIDALRPDSPTVPTATAAPTVPTATAAPTVPTSTATGTGPSPSSSSPPTPLPADTALVIATSGSTGTPKGAQLSLAALRASATATAARLGAPGRWLLPLPAHHIAGLQVVLRSLAAGHEPVLVDVSRGFDPATIPAAVSQLGAHTTDPLFTSLVPGQLLKVLDHPDPAPARALARLDAILLGGAAADPRVLERAADAGITVVRTYGSSETAGGCVYDGRPLDGTCIDIDADSRVWLGGPMVASGYRNAPGHPAFSRAGWFRTDDAGRLDPSGTLQILGRLDSAVSVGGLTVLPQVVEQALLLHPAVSEVAVVGIPDPRLGNRLVAAIVLRAGEADPGAAELSEAVRRELGDHAAPARYVVTTQLPVLANGKVDRQRLTRELAESPR